MTAPKTPALRAPVTRGVDHILHLPAGTLLARVYAQPVKAAARALAFNPLSNGRASPVANVKGVHDSAMYVSVDSQQGATLEMLFHTVLKKYPGGGVVPQSIFASLKLVTLKLTAPIRLISVESLQAHGIITPPNFSLPRTDYSDTQAVAQSLYNRYPKVAGICWHSAQGPAVVAALFESRMPPGVLQKHSKVTPLYSAPMDDFIAEVLAHHGLTIAP